MKVIPIQVGEIAIEEGYINSSQLKNCLEMQRKTGKPPDLLGELLVEKGYLTQEDLDRILKMQQIYKIRLENEYFIHSAIKKKYLDTFQVRQLRRKYELEMGSGNLSSIATIAITEGDLSMPLVEEIIKSPEYQSFAKLKRQGKTVLGGYELVGGIIKLKRAIIYKAMQVELDRMVAVKTLIRDFESEECIRKFFNEAKVTARFNHPNLVKIYDTGIEKNGYYYAMELVEGVNLAQKLGNKERLQVGEATRVIRQIAKALAHIHSYKMIHCQVNPRNIVIRADGVAKLLDMSASRSIDPPCTSNGKLTKMPQYMAPEQVTPGENLEVRTDIYCLGAAFYRMLTGHPPITGKTVEEIRKNIVNQEPTPIQELDYTIPEDLAKIVHRMLRKDISKRYKEIKNVLFALRKLMI